MTTATLATFPVGAAAPIPARGAGCSPDPTGLLSTQSAGVRGHACPRPPEASARGSVPAAAPAAGLSPETRAELARLQHTCRIVGEQLLADERAAAFRRVNAEHLEALREFCGDDVLPAPAPDRPAALGTVAALLQARRARAAERLQADAGDDIDGATLVALLVVCGAMLVGMGLGIVVGLGLCGRA